MRYLRIAVGSACELETQILLATRLGFMASADAGNVIAGVEELRRMATALIDRVLVGDAD